ncbi:MAG: hypothetical protein Q8R14_00265, partial [Candidatus Omnitrophota bacterium]|nr:hypothetical protein [Candidatus Omnitrophota bacterium]
MKRLQKIISVALLFAFLLNTCAYDLSFAANLRSNASADNLSPYLRTGNITGQQGIERVKFALQLILQVLKKDGVKPEKFAAALRESQKPNIVLREEKYGVKIRSDKKVDTNLPGEWFECLSFNNITGIRTGTYYANLILQGQDTNVEVYTQDAFKKTMEARRLSDLELIFQVLRDYISALKKPIVVTVGAPLRVWGSRTRSEQVIYDEAMQGALEVFIKGFRDRKPPLNAADIEASVEASKTLVHFELLKKDEIDDVDAKYMQFTFQPVLDTAAGSRLSASGEFIVAAEKQELYQKHLLRRVSFTGTGYDIKNYKASFDPKTKK